jgi:hypothetical protein
MRTCRLHGVALHWRCGPLVLCGGRAVDAHALLAAFPPEAIVGGAICPGEDADAIFLSSLKLSIIPVTC